MGREIRRVPPNWDHPKYTEENSNYSKKAGSYIPLYDEDFETRAREWLDECIAWEDGTHVDLVDHFENKIENPYFWQWEGDPPDPESYRPRFESDPTWYQVYETVSEGTPVTPPFATKEELINYLVEHGDFWDQSRGDGGWDRNSAEGFIDREWSPSLVIIKEPDGSGIMYSPRDGFPE